MKLESSIPVQWLQTPIFGQAVSWIWAVNQIIAKNGKKLSQIIAKTGNIWKISPNMDAKITKNGKKKTMWTKVANFGNWTYLDIQSGGGGEKPIILLWTVQGDHFWGGTIHSLGMAWEQG